MFCASCGKEIPTGVTACPGCGTAIPRPRGLSGLLLTALILGAAAIAIYAVRSSPGPIEIKKADKLFSEHTVVPHGGMVWKQFTFDASSMRDARIVGKFRATGGSGNDIQAILADSDNFENWKNGHAAHVLYSSDKTTVGSVSVPISASGTYFFCFSNTFSGFTDKDVSTDLEVRYTQFSPQ